jgi:hypothetical protein
MIGLFCRFFRFFNLYHLWISNKDNISKNDTEVYETDCSALRSDWEKVGEDFKKVIGNYEE